MQEIESYHHLCNFKSGEIAVDQHLLYLQKRGLGGLLASKFSSKTGTGIATKSDSQIPITGIQEVEAVPGDKRKKPRVTISFFREGKPGKKNITFTDVDKGGDRDFQAFVQYLKNRKVNVRITGQDAARSSTQAMSAVEEKPPLAVRMRWVIPILWVVLIAGGIAFFLIKQYIFGGLCILWTLFFIYKYFYGDK